MVARRMKDKFVKGPDVQRNRESVDVEGSGTRTDEALRYDSDQIGLRDYVQSLQVVRNGKRNVSLAALLPKPRIDWIFRELTPNDSDMPRFEKLLGIRHPCCDRVATSNRTSVAIRKETLLRSL